MSVLAYHFLAGDKLRDGTTAPTSAEVEAMARFAETGLPTNCCRVEIAAMLRALDSRAELAEAKCAEQAAGWGRAEAEIARLTIDAARKEIAP